MTPGKIFSKQSLRNRKTKSKHKQLFLKGLIMVAPMRVDSCERIKIGYDEFAKKLSLILCNLSKLNSFALLILQKNKSDVCKTPLV